MRTARTPRLVRYGPAVAATLAAGAVMMAGGFLFRRHGWAVAGPAMIPAGPLISVAFALERRAGARRAASAGGARLRGAVMLIAGLPSPGGNLPLTTSIAVQAVTLLAGVVMAVAGYAAATWNPLLVPPLLGAGGLVMTTAFVIGARGDRPAGASDDAPGLAVGGDDR